MVRIDVIGVSRIIYRGTGISTATEIDIIVNGEISIIIGGVVVVVAAASITIIET